MRLSTIMAMIGIAVCVAGCGGAPPPPMMTPEIFDILNTPDPDVVPIAGDLGGDVDPIDVFGGPPARRETDPPEHASAPPPTVTLVAETLPPGLFVMLPASVPLMAADQVNQALVAQLVAALYYVADEVLQLNILTAGYELNNRWDFFATGDAYLYSPSLDYQDDVRAFWEAFASAWGIAGEPPSLNGVRLAYDRWNLGESPNAATITRFNNVPPNSALANAWSQYALGQMLGGTWSSYPTAAAPPSGNTENGFTALGAGNGTAHDAPKSSTATTSPTAIAPPNASVSVASGIIAGQHTPTQPPPSMTLDTGDTGPKTPPQSANIAAPGALAPTGPLGLPNPAAIYGSKGPVTDVPLHQWEPGGLPFKQGGNTAPANVPPVADVPSGPTPTVPIYNSPVAGPLPANGPKPPTMTLDTEKGAAPITPSAPNTASTAMPNAGSVSVATPGLGGPSSGFGGVSTTYSSPTAVPGSVSIHDLPGGGKELVRPGVNGPVHEIYGPPLPGSTQNTLITTYTGMPVSGMSLNSTAAQSNTGPPEVHDLPNGGREVTHPSEFVPDATNHIVYGPPDANGNRTVIKSFLTQNTALNTGPYVPDVPPVVGDLHPAPKSTVPASSSTPSSSPNTAAPSLPPSRVSTVPAGIPGGDVINPGPPTAPSAANTTRQELLKELNPTTPAQATGSPTQNPAPTSRASLMQEMQSTLTPPRSVTPAVTNSAVLPSNASRLTENPTTTTPSLSRSSSAVSSNGTSRIINTSVVRNGTTAPQPAPRSRVVQPAPRPSVVRKR